MLSSGPFFVPPFVSSNSLFSALHPRHSCPFLSFRIALKLVMLRFVFRIPAGGDERERTIQRDDTSRPSIASLVKGSKAFLQRTSLRQQHSPTRAGKKP